MLSWAVNHKKIEMQEVIDLSALLNELLVEIRKFYADILSEVTAP